jgi:hypothetical protein
MLVSPSLESRRQLLTTGPGKWRGNFALGHDPKNKTLGILGMGGIGSAVAHRAKAFGMNIQYHNRNRLPENKEAGAKYVSFEELLKTSDVLNLNLALNPSTRHIIGKDQFVQMKDGVVIVNTARGPLIDEAALVDALKSGKVWTVGLDVFEEEPKIHPGLLECENAVLLPHVGTGTFETQVSCNETELTIGPWLTCVARYGIIGIGQPQVGDTAREAVDTSTGAEEGQGEHLNRPRYMIRNDHPQPASDRHNKHNTFHQAQSFFTCFPKVRGSNAE